MGALDGIGGFLDGFGIGGLLDAGVNIFNAVSQSRQFKYQRDLNNLLMEREDNAVQRRMKDLAAAGLNPLLAGSQSASTMGLSSGVAPQMVTGLFNEAENRGIKKVQQKKDFEFMDNQIDKMNEEVKNVKAQNDVIQAQYEKHKIENEILRGQLRQYQESGFYPTSSFGKLYFDLLNAGRAFPQVFPYPFKSIGTGLTDNADDFVDSVITESMNSAGKLGNDIQVFFEGKSNGETDKTQRNLANTLNNAFGDEGFLTDYYGGKFHLTVMDTPPRYYEFDTYQEIKHFIDKNRR